MKDELEPAKEMLRSFLAEMEKAKAIRNLISFTIEESEFDLQSYWEQEDAYMWLYADPWEYRSLMLEPKTNPIQEYYLQPALPVYLQWQQEPKKVFNRQCEKIPPPTEGTSLADYLYQLNLAIIDQNEQRNVWILSFRSFLQFLRDDTRLNEKGSLEILFPSQVSCEGMELRKGQTLGHNNNNIEEVSCQYILRRIEDAAHSIDIWTASEILANLSTTVLTGRPNSQRSAAVALGFGWLCHAAGSCRLLTRENLVYSTQLDRFRPIDMNIKKERLKPAHFIGIDSLFDVIDAPTSQFLYKFLLALPRRPGTNLIFDMNWDIVLRAFRNKGVKKCEQAQKLGQITFLTFLSQLNHDNRQRPCSIASKKLSPA